MNITTEDLITLHKTYYDMCFVNDFLKCVLHDPFSEQNKDKISFSSTTYPKVLLDLMENMGIYSPNLRLFNTFQNIRYLQPMSKIFSLSACHSVNEQNYTLVKMLSYIIPRISFINECLSKADVQKLKPRNRLRLEKMIVNRKSINNIPLMQPNFIDYKVLEQQYGYIHPTINDKAIHPVNRDNIKEQVKLIFNQLKLEHDKQLDWVDTYRSFDEMFRDGENDNKEELKVSNPSLSLKAHQEEKPKINYKKITFKFFIGIIIGLAIVKASLLSIG
ncbi:hypothetical protein DY052_06235 [Apilactobacillus timberlakei]|uniref:hypothetical protein n=1 Tax=Apilactobacillus timberlakei TaxID=2008380 RepID=UPI001125C701|nr:hypothetical protein [Apilactobacillus timberlakei]TPR15022.1 hypothetical protein DY052_06235 [Apilactobacillus timberlakei]